MAGYVPLPAYQVPRNAMLDFSGLNAGIDAINERNQQDRLAAERKDERTYQRGRNAMADRRYAEETAYRHGRDQLQDQRYADETAYTRGRQGVVDSRAATEFSNSQEDRAQTKFTERVKLLAPHVEKYVIGEKDPALRAQRWNDVLAMKGLENAPDQFRDPVTGPDLFLSTARGFLNKDKPANVQEWEHFQRLSPEEQQKYLTMKRAEKWLDTGTQFVSPSPGNPNGAPRTVEKNVAEEARLKEVGKGQGEGQVGLPKAETALRDYEIKNGLVMQSIDKALGQAGPWTTGLTGQIASNIGGTAAHDLSKTLTAIQSNLGFDTLQQMRDNSPTGGALGSITERELELLQATWGSLVQSQSEKQFRENLMELKRIKHEFAALKKDAYQRDVARFGAGNVPNQAGAQPSAPASPSGWSIQRID